MKRKSVVKINKKEMIHYLLIYILLCFQGSLGFRIYNNYFVIATVAIALIFWIKNFKKIKIVYSLFLYILSLTLIVEVIITNFGISFNSIISILARFLIIMTAYYYDKKKFVERYVKIIISMAIISLIGFLITSINSNILMPFFSKTIEKFHTYWTSYNVIYYGRFLYVFRPDLNQNLGIYHEPGLHQIVLCSGLYCLLFKPQFLNLNNKKRIINILVLIVSLLTTMSTTGYIGLFLLIVIYFIFEKNKNNRKIKRYISLLTIFSLIAIRLQGSDNFIYKAIFSKIINTDGNFDLSVSTGHSRVMSMIADLNIVKEYPFGIGYSNYNEVWKNFLLDSTISDVSSCVGITQVLAILGIGITLLILGFYILLSNKNQTGTEKLAFWCLFINITLAQPQIWFPSLIVLLLIEDNIKICDNKLPSIGLKIS